MNTYNTVFPASKGIRRNCVFKRWSATETWNRCRKDSFLAGCRGRSESLVQAGSWSGKDRGRVLSRGVRLGEARTGIREVEKARHCPSPPLSFRELTTLEASSLSVAHLPHWEGTIFAPVQWSLKPWHPEEGQAHSRHSINTC